MKIKLCLDGSFSSEEHHEIGKIYEDENYYIKWEINTIPIKGDYIDLDSFTNDLPKFAKNRSWRVKYRTFLDKETISLYLILCD